MHNGISSYLPTGRAGDTTMVWVRSTHKHRENESRRTEQRDRKKVWKSEMDEVELGFQPWCLGERDVQGLELSHQQRVMA